MTVPKKHSNRIEHIKKHHDLMLVHLSDALDLYKKMESEDKAGVQEIIASILGLKYNIEQTAASYGYSRLCRNSISDCRGACCKWHFPKNLDVVDFFLSIWGLAREKQNELLQLLENIQDNFYFCPMLKPNGCFFSFAQRPIECTIAYPCFTQDVYWAYTKSMMKQINGLKNQLSRTIRKLTL